MKNICTTANKHFFHVSLTNDPLKYFYPKKIHKLKQPKKLDLNVRVILKRLCILMLHKFFS